MRTRIEGVVNLKNGDALKGAVSRMAWPWRFLRVDNAIGLAAADPRHPQTVDGVVWVPKENVSFVQELLKTETTVVIAQPSPVVAGRQIVTDVPTVLAEPEE